MRRAASFALALAVFSAARDGGAAPTVWAIDDGEKVKQDAPPSPLATGVNNPVWSPGQPIRLFSMKNETVAFQIVVGTDAEAVASVTVDLDVLATDDGATIQNGLAAKDATSFVGRPIERFVEHFFDVTRASGGKHAGESLHWARGSGPSAGAWTGKLPDALIPVEVAPSWSPYPMAIAPHQNGIVWIDVTVPKTQKAGTYKGSVIVKAGATTLASIPVVLDVVDMTLPDRPVRTMLYYDREELDRRIGGGDAAEVHLWQLFHRHRLSAMHTALSTDDVTRALGALDGSLFTAARGYEGPGESIGDGVLSIGSYGVLGAPDAAKLTTVASIADLLATKSLLPTTDTFVYAIDETCSSPYGAAWKALISGSSNPNVERVRVGWTCNEPTTKQPVDIAMVPGDFDPDEAAAARALGKEVWIYNGAQPHSGTFFTDSPAVSTRVNGWLQGMFGIARWFFWETTFWYDGNRGGKGAYDPFVTAETFHNSDGDYCQGDGVLVYPGKQIDRFTNHSIGMNGVVASIRLKNWRRGIEDAGYYQLAHAADAAKAEAIAKRLLPRVLVGAKDGQPPSWPDTGKAYFDARRALLDLIPKGTNGGAGLGSMPSDGDAGVGLRMTAGDAGADAGHPSGWGRTRVGVGVVVMLAIAAALLYRMRRGRRG